VDHDSRRAVGLSGQVERVGYLVETNDRADARERIEAPGRHGVVPMIVAVHPLQDLTRKRIDSIGQRIVAVTTNLDSRI
jgi:hypothetical protein